MVLPTLTNMSDESPAQGVEITFVGAPPLSRLERASGVSDVVIDGPVLRCVVRGSFQPFLEAISGHEVISLRTGPAMASPTSVLGEGR